MDPATIIAAISAVIKTVVDLTPAVIKTAQDAEPFAAAIVGMFKGTNITEDQLKELEMKITMLSNQLQEPLPPDDGTTTT